MEFQIQKEDNPNINKYARDELNIAYKFSKRLYEEFGELVKAIILFGSSTRRDMPQGDIDILILIDDVTSKMSAELVETYRIIVEKLVAEISPRLHITSLKLTTFWEYIRAGDPVGINMLREGVALLDTGFFDPLRALLENGRIRPSPESVSVYFERAPITLQNSKWHLLQATIDLYWAVIDSAHAALMKAKVAPPNPREAAKMMQEHLVKPGHVPKKYVATMEKFFVLSKKIIYREIRTISGGDYERYRGEAEEFVNAMEKYIKKPSSE